MSPRGKWLCLVYGSEFQYAGSDPGPTQIELWGLNGPEPHLVWNKPFTRASHLQFYSARHHDRGPVRVFFNLADTRVAIADDNSVVVFDLSHGKRRTFLGGLQIYGLAFGSDWRAVFCGSSDGGIVVSKYRDKAGEFYSRDTWKGHRGRVLALAVSPDQRVLASGGKDQTICLWEAATGRRLAVWHAHDKEVTALAFSPDGKALVSAGGDGTLKVWNLLSMRKELSSLGLGW
jgi:WD40 repeat protein